jgi:hypothetical protein
MKATLTIICWCAALWPLNAAFGGESLCEAQREFVSSVQRGETREFTFHTSWDADFKDSSEDAIYAKRCNHDRYAPAKKVCEYLMEHGAVEFAGNNVKDALACLSPETRLARALGLHRASFSFSFGTDDRGALVEIEFSEDQEVGGMAFKVVADGY